MEKLIKKLKRSIILGVNASEDLVKLSVRSGKRTWFIQINLGVRRVKTITSDDYTAPVDDPCHMFDKMVGTKVVKALMSKESVMLAVKGEEKTFFQLAQTPEGETTELTEEEFKRNNIDYMIKNDLGW